MGYILCYCGIAPTEANSVWAVRKKKAILAINHYWARPKIKSSFAFAKLLQLTASLTLTNKIWQLGEDNHHVCFGCFLKKRDGNHKLVPRSLNFYLNLNKFEEFLKFFVSCVSSLRECTAASTEWRILGKRAACRTRTSPPTTPRPTC